VDRWELVAMHAVVCLGKMQNFKQLFLLKFYGSNQLVRRCLDGVIPEINFIHVLKSRQTLWSMLIVLLALFNFATMYKALEDFNTFIAEWINENYRPFIYLALLKLSTQKNWMKKIK
jgi:hypothetical protein